MFIDSDFTEQNKDCFSKGETILVERDCIKVLDSQ